MKRNRIGVSIVICLILLCVLPGETFGQTSKDLEPLFKQYDSLVKRGSYDEAIAVGEKGLALSEKVYGPEAPLTGKVLFNLASLYQVKSDFNKAESLYQRALGIAEKLSGPTGSDALMIKISLGRLYNAEGDYRRAKDVEEQALAGLEKSYPENDLRLAYCLDNLASVYFSLGDRRTLPILQRALSSYEQNSGKESTRLIGPLLSQGMCFCYLGDYESAQGAMDRAFNICLKNYGHESVFTAQCLSSQGSLYTDMSDKRTARAKYEEAFDILRKLGGTASPEAVAPMVSLAIIRSESGDVKGARELAEKAVQICDKSYGPTHHLTGLNLLNVSQVYVNLHDYRFAHELLTRAYNIYNQRMGPDHIGTAYALAFLGNTSYLMGNYGEAEPLLEHALDMGRKVLPEEPKLLYGLRLLALVKIDLDKPTEALELASEGETVRKRILTNILSFGSEEERLSYEQVGSPYSLEATLGAPSAVSLASLRFKGVVQDSVARQLKVAQRNDVAGIHELVTRLREAKAELSQLTLRSLSGSSGSQGEEAKQARTALHNQIDQLEGQLARSVGNGANEEADITVDRVSSVLSSASVLVDYIRYPHYLGKANWEDRYGATIVCLGSPPVWVQLGTAKEIDALIDRYQSAVRGGSQGTTSEEEIARVLAALYQTVWAPVEGHLPKECQTVYLSPDGQLNLVSYATLLRPDRRFLAEQYELSYVGCGRDLLTDVQPVRTKDLVIFADPAFGESLGHVDPEPHTPVERSALKTRSSALTFQALPGTALESEALGRLAESAGWSVRAFKGPEATKARLLSLRSPRILHLATHGFFLPGGEDGGNLDAMYRSGLAFAGAQRGMEALRQGETLAADDGILTAGEAGALKLDGTWLVTLSACDTGEGKVQAGEGVLGLRRGFVQAGAQNLLMTLWSVPDQATAGFMAEFYQAALEHGDAPGALARVQRDWLVRLRSKSGIFTAVHIAGPFILTFQGRPPGGSTGQDLPRSASPTDGGLKK